MWAAKADAAPSTPFVSFARPPGSPEPKAVYPLIGSGAPLTPPKDGYKPSFLMQEMSKSRSSTSPTRQSHEVRGSPTKLAGDKTGPTVGLDSFAIQTAKKTFTAMHATTNREGNSPFGMYKSASPPKVGTDSFMVSNVRATTERAREAAASPGLLRGFSAVTEESLMNRFVHEVNEMRKDTSPTKARNPFNLAGSLKPATILTSDFAIKVSTSVPKVPVRRMGGGAPFGVAAKPNIGGDAFMFSHLKKIAPFKGGAAHSKEVRL